MWDKKMKDFKLRADDDFIKLGQLLKAVGLVDTGVEAKFEILDGKVKVNGETAYERGKKIHNGDTVLYKSQEIKVIK